MVGAIFSGVADGSGCILMGRGKEMGSCGGMRTDIQTLFNHTDFSAFSSHCLWLPGKERILGGMGEAALSWRWGGWLALG